MVLTLEQQSAVRRGEAVTLRLPDVEGDCILIHKDQYLELTRLEAEMATVRQRTQQLLTPTRIKELLKKYPVDASWHEEDHSKLYEGGT